MSGLERLSGRVIVVTGASSGNGAAIARLFAEQGATLVLAARGRGIDAREALRDRQKQAATRP